MRLKQEVFDLVHENTDAFMTSEMERSQMDLESEEGLIYGEVLFDHFVPTLGFVKPLDGEVFWDLGCGAGRPLITAALAFP